MIYSQHMEKEGGLTNYSDLIGLIYDAAQNPVLWPELLAALKEFLGNGDTSHNRENTHKELLEPHFQRAVEMNQRLHQLEQENHTTTAILNRLPIGIIIITKDAVPIAMNDRARDLLDLRQELQINDSILVSSSRKETEELHRLIRACISPSESPKGKSMVFASPRNSDHASIWITSSASSPAGSDEALHATIYIASSLIRPEFSVDALQQSYGLTRAEARLVKILVNGCNNLNEAAEELNLSIHTVRTQIKSVFEKTFTGNQMELVKKVLTSPSVMFSNQQETTHTSAYLLKHEEIPPDCAAIKLYDGRRLSYAEYGASDGRPVFLFHGIAGSRLQYPAEETAAAKLGLRFIVPDRPGHGYSDSKDNRTILDWPKDVIQLADQLELGTFSIMGFAGGCSYALACAYEIPERIEKTVLVTASAPVDTFTKLPAIDATLLRMARYTPGLLTKSIQIMLSDILRDPIKKLEKRYRHHSESDRQAIEDHPAQRQMYARAMIESGRQGAKGIAQDLITLMQPNSLPVREIRANVQLWHGIEDVAMPVSSAKKLEHMLTNCHATYVPDIGSMLIIKKWDEILENLAANMRSS